MKKLDLGAGKKARQTGGPTSSPAEKPAPKEEILDKFEGKKPVTVQVFTLAGVTHSQYPFEELQENQPVILVPDPYGQVVKPDQGHPDPTAISVQDTAGRHIGYLKAMVAKVIHQALTSKRFEYEAKVSLIKGGYQAENGKKLNWGVDVRAAFYEVEAQDND